MANTAGGLIILGVEELDGSASSLSPVALSEDEELRMRQVVASLVAPVPRFDVIRIPSTADGTSGFFALAIDHSPDAPHAVRINDAIRYPRRHGPSTRYLTESRSPTPIGTASTSPRALTHDRLRSLPEERSDLILTTARGSLPGWYPARQGSWGSQWQLLNNSVSSRDRTMSRDQMAWACFRGERAWMSAPACVV